MFVINVPLYGVGILFAFNVSEAMIIRKMKPFNLTFTTEDLNGEKPWVGLTIVKGNTFVIRMKQWPERASHYDTLQHEIFHVADETLRSSGLSLENNSAEAWAYLIGHITGRAYNQLWDKKYH